MPNCDPKCPGPGSKTMCGGQALIEGIMMRGPKKQSIVVRRPDGGLEIKVGDLKLIKDRHPVLGWPLIRGVVNFCSSMVNGVRALMYSADFYPEEEGESEEPSKFERWLENKLGSEKMMKVVVIFAAGFALLRWAKWNPILVMVPAGVAKPALALITGEPAS